MTRDRFKIAQLKCALSHRVLRQKLTRHEEVLCFCELDVTHLLTLQEFELFQNRFLRCLKLERVGKHECQLI